MVNSALYLPINEKDPENNRLTKFTYKAIIIYTQIKAGP